MSRSRIDASMQKPRRNRAPIFQRIVAQAALREVPKTEKDGE